MPSAVTITPKRTTGDLPGMLDMQRLHVTFDDDRTSPPAVYYVDRGTRAVFYAIRNDKWIECRNHALADACRRAAGFATGKRQSVTVTA